MPIYEYKCENGHVFDVMRKLSDEPLTSCIECGAPVRKVLHPVGISFKGSGFYSTDYSSKSSTETATSTTTNGASKSGSGDEKSKEKSAGSSTSTGKKD